MMSRFNGRQPQKIQEEEKSDEGENNFGFQAGDSGAPTEGEEEGQAKVRVNLKRRHEEESDEDYKQRMETMQHISNLLSRFPQVKPRSSFDQLESLEQLQLIELLNVYRNMISDIQLLRGTPASEFFIKGTTYFMDRYLLPGIQDRCLSNDELVKDVDALVLQTMGGCGLISDICFHVLNIFSDMLLDLRSQARQPRELPPNLQPPDPKYAQSAQDHQSAGTSR